MIFDFGEYMNLKAYWFIAGSFWAAAAPVAWGPLPALAIAQSLEIW
jgi:hypothetical protein